MWLFAPHHYNHHYNHMWNQANGWAKHHGRGDVETRKDKRMCGGTGISFLSFNNRYSVCVCRSVLWVLVSVVCLCAITWNKLHNELSAENTEREPIALQAVRSTLIEIQFRALHLGPGPTGPDLFSTSRAGLRANFHVIVQTWACFTLLLIFIFKTSIN